jgi:hypothetical protein
VNVGIPSDLTGLLLFVILLLPGFAYNSVRARRRPDRQLTALHETVIVVTASLATLTAVGVVFAIIRALLPGVTPDVRAALFSTHAYLQAHYVRTTWWAVALLAVAVLSAMGVASAQENQWLRRSRYLRGLAAPPDPSTQSGWWIAFRPGLDAGHEVHVGCTLDDGSYVSGRLRSYSQVAEDTADRDLVLRAPVKVRPRGATDAREVPNVTMMTISARHIVTMAVTYVARMPSPQPASQPAPAAPTLQAQPPAQVHDGERCPASCPRCSGRLRTDRRSGCPGAGHPLYPRRCPPGHDSGRRRAGSVAH